MHVYAQTCLQHLLNAEVGMLGGAIWSKTPLVALKRGMTIIKTVIETSPKHKTSAFCTLKRRISKSQVSLSWSRQLRKKGQFICALVVYPRDKNQDASIRPALRTIDKNVLKIHDTKRIFIFPKKAYSHAVTKRASMHVEMKEKRGEEYILPADRICENMQANWMVVHICSFSVD